MPSTSPAAQQPAVDATIRIGVVLLTLTTAAVHLSLLFPIPRSSSTAWGTSRSWRRCTCLSPASYPTGASCADRVRGADAPALGRHRGAYPAWLRDHGRRGRLGRVIGTRRQEAASPR